MQKNRIVRTQKISQNKGRQEVTTNTKTCITNVERNKITPQLPIELEVCQKRYEHAK